MVEADEAASSQGHRDETFAVIRVNGGATFLDHKGFGGKRPRVSRRALLGLREAGLFRVVNETRNLLRFYLPDDARTRLVQPQPLGEGSGGQPRTQPQPRSRGRPKGTRSVPRQQIIDVFRSLRTNYGTNPTQAELAANLNPRIELRTLQAHLTDYGLPWPIE
jgi:hypothetical protein